MFCLRLLAVFCLGSFAVLYLSLYFILDFLNETDRKNYLSLLNFVKKGANSDATSIILIPVKDTQDRPPVAHTVMSCDSNSNDWDIWCYVAKLSIDEFLKEHLLLNYR